MSDGTTTYQARIKSRYRSVWQNVDEEMLLLIGEMMMLTMIVGEVVICNLDRKTGWQREGMCGVQGAFAC